MAANLPDVPEASVLTPEERLAFEAAWAAWWQDVQLLDTTSRGFFGMAWRAAKAYLAFHEQQAAPRWGESEQPVQASGMVCPNCRHHSSAEYPIIATTAAYSDASGFFTSAGRPTYCCPRCCHTWPQEHGV